MAARWEILGRSYHNAKWDLLHCRAHYSNCSIDNDYLVLKHEKRVPKELMEERKWGESRRLDGKAWKEGTIKKGNTVTKKEQPRHMRVTKLPTQGMRITPTYKRGNLK
tara:strand:+ start:44 stop:367 length:324 start_codon:yes stop_codon:yes gene_type:complete